MPGSWNKPVSNRVTQTNMLMFFSANMSLSDVTLQHLSVACHLKYNHFWFQVMFPTQGDKICPTLLSLPPSWVGLHHFLSPCCSSITASDCTIAFMQTPDVVNFTVMATVGVAFLQQQLSEHTANRVRQFENIVAACSSVLQFLGRSRFLDSLFQLWGGLTHSLILMEDLLFPEQPIQTSSQLALPREPFFCLRSWTIGSSGGHHLFPWPFRASLSTPTGFTRSTMKISTGRWPLYWMMPCFFSKVFTRFYSFDQKLQPLLMLRLTLEAMTQPPWLSSRHTTDWRGGVTKNDLAHVLLCAFSISPKIDMAAAEWLMWAPCPKALQLCDVTTPSIYLSLGTTKMLLMPRS